MNSHHVHIKISEFFKTSDPLLVNKVEVFIAETTEEVWVLGGPHVVHGDPDGDAGVAHNADDLSDVNLLGLRPESPKPLAHWEPDKI